MERRRKKIVAIDCPRLSFFQHDVEQVMQGIFRYIREHRNWNVMLNEYWFSFSCRFRNYEELLKQEIDGLLFQVYKKEVAELASQLNVPAVDYSGFTEDVRFPSVRLDNIAIGRMAFEYFQERGFRNYAYFGPRDRKWSMDRATGFQQAAKESGFRCFMNTPQMGAHFAHQQGWISPDGLFEWLKQLPKPVAIFVCYDPCAIDIMQGCQMCGIDVPSEAAILGVNNTECLCDTVHPSLSSVEVDCEDQGYRIAQLLDRLMSDPDYADTQQKISPKYVVTRMSTDILAVEDEAVAAALHFIARHFAEPISTPDVANAAGLSRSHLTRRFKASVNHTIGAEIRRRRLNKAKELLRNTSMSLAAIANEAGFRYANYFVNAFVKKEGVSPTAWRKRYKQ
ncbi:MAG: DNA-binding transcriptional regulator [Pirellulales bacterium]|nr:DNA-binding transcriptional regulator [Pirellulales bacterium]